MNPSSPKSHPLLICFIIILLSTSSLINCRITRILAKKNQKASLLTNDTPIEIDSNQIMKTSKMLMDESESYSKLSISSQSFDGLDNRGGKRKPKTKTKFRKCNLDIAANYDLIEQKTEHLALYMLKGGDRQNAMIFNGVKMTKYKKLKGMYRFLHGKLPNRQVMDSMYPALPKFGGCYREYVKMTKSERLTHQPQDTPVDPIKSVEVLYEHLPDWVYYLSSTGTSVTNQLLTEMVHQVFIFFKRFFRMGGFAKNFDSSFIGVRQVANVNIALDIPKIPYSQPTLAFMFRSPEFLEYRCNFIGDKTFKKLMKVFVKDKERAFSFKNETEVDICQHITVYNLLKILETSLFKVAGMELPTKRLLRGCLKEPEDKHKPCPKIILAALGMDADKNYVAQTQKSMLHYNAIKSLRNNFLGYKTASTVIWFEAFLVELLKLFHRQSLSGKFQMASSLKKLEEYRGHYQTTLDLITLKRKEMVNDELYVDQFVKISQLVVSLTSVINKHRVILGVVDKPVMSIDEESRSRGQLSNSNSSGQSLGNSSVRSQEQIKLVYSDSDYNSQKDLSPRQDSPKMQILKNASQNSSQEVIVPKNSLVSKIKIDSTPESSANSRSQSSSKDHTEGDLSSPSKQIQVEDTLNIKGLVTKDIDEDTILSDIQNLTKIQTIANNMEISVDKESELQKVEILDGDKSTHSLNGSASSQEQIQVSMSKKTLVKSKSYQFASNEQLALVQKMDSNGMEYLSLEINYKMINPKDFGFDTFNSGDEVILHQKVQEFFMKALQSDENIVGTGMKLQSQKFLI